MLPVGTMYASNIVTLMSNTVKIMLMIAITSRVNYLFPVLMPAIAYPIAPRAICPLLPIPKI